MFRAHPRSCFYKRTTKTESTLPRGRSCGRTLSLNLDVSWFFSVCVDVVFFLSFCRCAKNNRSKKECSGKRLRAYRLCSHKRLKTSAHAADAAYPAFRNRARLKIHFSGQRDEVANVHGGSACGVVLNFSYLFPYMPAGTARYTRTLRVDWQNPKPLMPVSSIARIQEAISTLFFQCSCKWSNVWKFFVSILGNFKLNLIRVQEAFKALGRGGTSYASLRSSLQCIDIKELVRWSALLGPVAVCMALVGTSGQRVGGELDRRVVKLRKWSHLWSLDQLRWVFSGCRKVLPDMKFEKHVQMSEAEEVSVKEWYWSWCFFLRLKWGFIRFACVCVCVAKL